MGDKELWSVALENDDFGFVISIKFLDKVFELFLSVSAPEIVFGRVWIMEGDYKDTRVERGFQAAVGCELHDDGIEWQLEGNL